MAESLWTSETYNVVPDSYLTAVSQTVTGVTGDIVCGHMCLTAETYICVAYSYCHINRTCLLSEHLPASANGWQGLSDSNCDIYKISAGLIKKFSSLFDISLSQSFFYWEMLNLASLKNYHENIVRIIWSPDQQYHFKLILGVDIGISIFDVGIFIKFRTDISKYFQADKKYSVYCRNL